MLKSIWFLAFALCAATTGAAVIAVRHTTDRSFFALVEWLVIAVALVAPLLLLPGLLSPTAVYDDTARYTRAVRLILLIYMPLASALSLMAFSQR